MLVFVLAVCMIVMVIGLAALSIGRLRLRSVESIGDFDNARNYAMAAIDLGLHAIRIEQKDTWRDDFTTDAVVTASAPGGSMRLEVTDPVDGDLLAGADDPIVLTGIGVCNDARCKLEVRLEPSGPSMAVVPGSWTWLVD